MNFQGRLADASGNTVADGTTAFKLQNAGGTLDYLTLDTTNSRLTIGVSDTTGTLLVLDTKTGAGDPTGVNGAMYYNSSTNKFRCYENSAWKNCVPNTTKVINLMPIRTNIGGAMTYTKNTAVMTDLVDYKQVRVGYNREFTPGYSCTDAGSATISVRYSTNNGSSWTTLAASTNSATGNTVSSWASIPGGANAATVHLGVYASCSAGDVDGFMTDFTVELR